MTISPLDPRVLIDVASRGMLGVVCFGAKPRDASVDLILIELIRGVLKRSSEGDLTMRSARAKNARTRCGKIVVAQRFDARVQQALRA
jgi:hypothetical protein